MADKSVGELIAAQSVTPTDLFVLEQNGVAKKLTGQVLENWLVSFADGHGGIQRIEKVSTDVLADTYRITLADTTTFDFVVTNGRGVSNIQKKSTSGLVDTYAISYNDGTSGTFTVTNGAKGDKGDNAYIWVKYASREPVSSAVSLGDIPDAWMGIYVGTRDTAPTSYSEYKWYQIKGEKGDPGDPATLTSSKVEYHVSDSGTIIPSGAWSSSVPIVAQGKYLWTKIVQTFNTGNPVTAYTVSRMGLDGSGSVVSVCDISPDENGNVPLTAAHVGALPNTGGDMTGPINMNGQKLNGLNAPTESDEAATKGFVESQVRKAAPRNLLDNSDFRNPVNQGGKNTYTANGYTIDRWKVYAGQVNIVAGLYITVKGGVYQLISGLDLDKTYTVAVKTESGIVCVSGVFRVGAAATLGNLTISMTTGSATGGDYDYAEVVMKNADGYDVGIAIWAALYEGEYTVETLPEYHTDGYNAELNKCRWYYRSREFYVLRCYANGYLSGTGFEPMRINPTATVVKAQTMTGDTVTGETNVSVDSNASVSYVANPNFTMDEYYRVTLELNANL